MSASESTLKNTTSLGDYASSHVIPMTANSNVVPGSPWSRSAVLHSSSHNSPAPRDIGGTRTPSHTATGRADFSPHTFSMPYPIGHASPMSRHHGMATLDTHSFTPMMANPDVVSYGPLQSVPDRYNLGDARAGMLYPPHGTSMMPYPISHASPTSRHHGMATSDMHSFAPMMANPDAVSYGPLQSVPDHYDFGDARFWPGMLYPPHGTSLMPSSISHASPTYRHHGMATSEMHSFAPMTANPDAASVPSTPDNLRTAFSYGPSQSVPYPHDFLHLGVMNQQSELPITRPPSRLRVCKWVHNNARCGYEGTLEDLNKHWNDTHLPQCPGAVIKCKWEKCRYRNRRKNKNSIRVMWRSSMWRHISEAHLKCPRH